MRPAIITLARGLMMTASAQAQIAGSQPGGHGKQGWQQSEKGASQKPKTDDKAYNAALRNLPDKKYDAWQRVR